MSKKSPSRLIFSGAMCVLAAIFGALGIWQVQRLFWKLDLIARVETRIHAAPSPAPGPGGWAAVNAAEDEYRHVRARGRFAHEKEALVQAVTEIGPGFWVITPLVGDDGSAILINRGFVPPEKKEPASRAAGLMDGPVEITGLLRMTEPAGAFLRNNNPAEDRWYSRDVTALARSRGLQDTAPYFIDADATPNPGSYPVGGLTVVRFKNTHLVYALTWFSMAAMSLFAAWLVLRPKTA